MSLAINVSSSSSGISSSIFPSSELKVSQIGSLRLSDRIIVSAASLSLSGKRSSVKPLNAQSFTKESMVPQAATMVASEVAEKVVEVEDFEELAKRLENASPLEIMDKALEKFGDDIAIAFSGAEDVALIEYAHLTGRPFRVFSLDTGRLNPETYRLFDTVEKHYGIRIEYMFPDAVEVQALVRNKGLFSFYEDGHQECCRIRKVRPLRRALKGLRAWITGQRKDQSPGTRSEIPVVQVDPVFEGLDGGAGSLVKWNPVANVEGNDVWNFLRTMDVPVNTLHAAGYVSIGCEPCTRAVLPGQHEREGRWWWEDAKAKECGLHKGNIKESDNGNAAANVNGTSAVADIFKSENVVSLSRQGVENLMKLENRKEAWIVVLYAPWCPFCQAMEEMNPLYYNFESTEEIPLPKEYASPVQKYYIERMELVRAVDFESYEKFEASLVKDLHRCPVACSVKLYPSFRDMTGKQLYDPTVNEEMQPGTHSMLLVARGRNEEAKHFLEFQDSYGTDVGDDGFVRVRMGKGLITRYVRLTL